MLCEARDEVVVRARLDEDPRPRLAALPGGVVDRPDRARDRVVEVRVGEDEVRALAAQLERDALDRLRAEPHDLAAGPRRSREGDLVDTGMTDEVGACRGAVGGDDVQDARREPDLGRELRDPQRAERRLRVRLQHDGAPGREGGRQLPRRHRQRVVPRDDLSGDADRLLQGVEEERAPERARAAGDRRDRGPVEAEDLGRLVDLELDRRDRLADVARLELGELLPVRDDRVGERVQEPRALGRRRLPPRPVERGAGGLDGAVDVGLPAIAARPSGSPVAGSTRSRSSPDAGSTVSPPMKRPYSRSTATLTRHPPRERGGACPGNRRFPSVTEEGAGGHWSPERAEARDACLLRQQRAEPLRAPLDVPPAEVAAQGIGRHVRAPERVEHEAHGRLGVLRVRAAHRSV